MSRKGLGKGLSALIPKEEIGIEEAPIEDILSSPFQPREDFTGIEELAQSIKENGIIEPLIVRRRKEKLEIVAGERRWRAAKIAGLKKVPVIVKEIADNEALQLSLIENLQREDLNPIEKAKGYKMLIEKFHLTHEEVAKKLSKSRSFISNTLRLLNLPEEIKRDLIEKRITEGHARVLLTLTPEERKKIRKRIIKNDLSVRETEKFTKKRKKREILPSYIEELQRKLGTKVQLVGSETKGKIVIKYFSMEDLERILEIMGVKFD